MTQPPIILVCVNRTGKAHATSKAGRTRKPAVREVLRHLDIPLRKCLLSLDGAAMTIDGKVIAPPM
jgi:hypothetical protein